MTEADRTLFLSLLPSARQPLREFGELTPIQRLALPAIMAEVPSLLIAPTASGKTEAALVPLVHLAEEQGWKGSPRVLWVAPTRALVNDLHRRLSLALRGHLTVGRKTADHRETDADLLVTTPESLDSMLVRGGRHGRAHLLSSVRAIVLDELHMLADGARGSQLNVLLPRLERVARPLIRVGVSATVWDAQTVARRFLGPGAQVLSAGAGRSLTIHHRGEGWPDLSPGSPDPLAGLIWPVMRPGPGLEVAQHLLEARRAGKLKALLFVSSRARCDKLSATLAKVLGGQSPVQVVAHHGSLSKEERERAERVLSEVEESVAVATPTLEIGIDIGDITTVVLDGPPGSVSSLLQRVGRANRRGGATHVLPLAGNGIEACIMASMLRAARVGELDRNLAPRHYSVAIQQAASVLRQDPTRRVHRRELTGVLEAEFGSMAEGLVEGLEVGEWLQPKDGGAISPGEALAELMDSDLRLHANIGGAGGLMAVVDDVTGEPIAWVPRQRAAKTIHLAGRMFETEATADAIRVRERDKADNGQPLRYATRKAPMMRSALRHLALGLGLPETAVVLGQHGWTHFGGALYASMLQSLGVAGGPLSSESDPRRASLGSLEESCRRNWPRLETLFGFGPFQRELPVELREAAVMDSLPLGSFAEWLQNMEEATLSESQSMLLYGD